MSLKPCKECGKEVSTGSKVCPHCGKKHPTGGLTLPAKIFLGIIILGVVVSIFSSKEKTTSTSNQKGATAVTSSSAPVDTKHQKTMDEGSVNDTAQFIKETKKELTGYYPSEDMIRSIGNRKMRMAEIAGRYEGSKDKALHALGAKARNLQKELQSLARRVYAKKMEQEMLDKGINMKIQAHGTNHTTLQVKYALISDAFIYQMQNKAHIDDQARALGFSQIVFTDGFDTTYAMKLDR